MSRALEMRAAFDHSFAEAPRTEAVTEQDFLAIRIGPDPYAIRLADITGLFADRRITRLPSADPAFLGIAGVRGAVVPVYELGAFLGYPAGEAWRWLLLIGGASLALAVDTFEGHLRVPQAALAAQVGVARSRDFVHEVLHVAGPARPIVHVRDVFHAIEQATQQRGHHEES
jgi:chemotaxis signal transduction protein